MQQTALYNAHLANSAKMVEFSNWQMPINYGSQIKEHEAVRTDCGMFDVSHMAITDITGIEARAFLRHLLSNDVAKLEKFGFGKALYSGMLNAEAGIIDDLIVYYTEFGYRLVTNAGTYEKDMKWITEVSRQFQVELTKRNDLSIIAVQGPNAVTKVATLRPDLADKLKALKPFMALVVNKWFYARTGYTGEDGLEVMLPSVDAEKFWDKLLSVGVTPCGLAARDTLRLEAGMNLYGHDMDETINPLECNMDWVVDLSDEARDFIGKAEYVKLKTTGAKFTQIGLVLEGRGVLREGQKVYDTDNHEIGVITSGTFSPTLKLSIAMARVQPTTAFDACVDIRGSLEAVRLVKLPFVRNNKILPSLHLP
ncbi:MAG TPA: glycine cleavage system aminomethyltransferase GcvT [Aquella sp.]|nr:glycine cleavage system aminomethyltransferase GcvT [Aquella sp.]